MDNPLVILGITAQMLEGLGTGQAQEVAKKVGRQTLANLHPDRMPDQFKKKRGKKEKRKKRFQEVKEALSEIDDFLSFKKHRDDLKDRESKNTVDRVRRLERLLSARSNQHKDQLRRVFTGLLEFAPIASDSFADENSIFSPGLMLAVSPPEDHASIPGSVSLDEKLLKLRIGEDLMLHGTEDTNLGSQDLMPIAVVSRSLADKEALAKAKTTKQLISEVHGEYNPSADRQGEFDDWLRRIPLKEFCEGMLPISKFTADKHGYFCSLRIQNGTPLIAVEGVIQKAERP
ncbi:MAG: hypothetical protein BRC25_00555 [Parcubacteria group bacterium SW_6_46_9]|nr:MAG: hypothetical protein BRC25_00555 [Parcubacteria group bacterium SW_6_46_9]